MSKRTEKNRNEVVELIGDNQNAEEQTKMQELDVAGACEAAERLDRKMLAGAPEAVDDQSQEKTFDMVIADQTAAEEIDIPSIDLTAAVQTVEENTKNETVAVVASVAVEKQCDNGLMKPVIGLKKSHSIEKNLLQHDSPLFFVDPEGILRNLDVESSSH